VTVCRPEDKNAYSETASSDRDISSTLSGSYERLPISRVLINLIKYIEDDDYDCEGVTCASGMDSDVQRDCVVEVNEQSKNGDNISVKSDS
jgi:hypothetical protein